MSPIVPRRGSSATTVALLMPVMLACVGMAVDWGQVSVARFQVQAAADEGALAAASAFNNAPTSPSAIDAAELVATERAAGYASQMQVNRLIPTVTSVTAGYYEGSTWSVTWPSGRGPNAVEVVTRGKVTMAFTRIFGLNEVTVTAKARAASGVVPGRAPDLVIVQDVTPSMDAVDIAASKTANAQLIDCIESRSAPDTRGAFVKFASIDKKVVGLQSYRDAPGALYAAASGSTSGSYTSGDVCLGSNGCTSHSAGLYAAVNLLNSASKPPIGVGQAIIVITDGAPYTGGDNCTSAVMGSSGGTPYQAWLRSQCTAVNGKTTQAACETFGGRWQKSGKKGTCLAADNGAENTSAMGVGKCSAGGWSTEARCEGNGKVWQQKSAITPNPSLLNQWTRSTKDLAAAGTWGPIDVYAVYYSKGHTADAYHNDNLAFLENQVVRGRGAEIGVLDAPNGIALTAVLDEVCRAYTSGAVGLIE